MLPPLTGVSLAAGTVWTWVQQVGQRVMAQLADELHELAAGTLPPAESLAAELAALPLVIGADGVMAPFRPHPGTPKGKTRWREIKVAILARLGERLTRHGQRVTRLGQRRLVAVLGTIDDLTPRLWRDAATISGYLGKGDSFDQAIGAFALAYADQTKRDHAALVKAVRAGRLEALINHE